MHFFLDCLWITILLGNHLHAVNPIQDNLQDRMFAEFRLGDAQHFRIKSDFGS